jgi:hypothetical protein
MEKVSKFKLLLFSTSISQLNDIVNTMAPSTQSTTFFQKLRRLITPRSVTQISLTFLTVASAIAAFTCCLMFKAQLTVVTGDFQGSGGGDLTTLTGLQVYHGIFSNMLSGFRYICNITLREAYVD